MNGRARVRVANQVASLLAKTGPRFLFAPAKDRVARFGLDTAEQVWYVDAFTGLLLYPFGTGVWCGFAEGPALRQLVGALAEYVRDGKQVDQQLLEHTCADSYGPAWPELRAELFNTHAVASPATATTGEQHERENDPVPAAR